MVESCGGDFSATCASLVATPASRAARRATGIRYTDPLFCFYGRFVLQSVRSPRDREFEHDDDERGIWKVRRRE